MESESLTAARRVYLYRLVVERPEGSDEIDWEPQGWEEICKSRYWSREHFSWPRDRVYLSATGAQNRASLLRQFGATVTIERSQEVQW